MRIVAMVSMTPKLGGLGLVDGHPRTVRCRRHAAHRQPSMLVCLVAVVLHRAQPARPDRAHRRVPAEIRKVEIVVEQSWPLRPPLRYGALVLGTGLGIGGVIFEVLARNNAADYRNAAGTPAEVDALASRAKSQHLTAQIMGGLAISAAATALGIYIWQQIDP